MPILLPKRPNKVRALGYFCKLAIVRSSVASKEMGVHFQIDYIRPDMV